MAVKKIRLEDLDWDNLRVFLAVVRGGSLSQAARQLRLDQSTVSRRIAQLELCVGGPLFERRREGLHCTQLAARLVPHVETMEGGIVGLREHLGGTGHQPAGTVRLAMMEGIGSQYIARQLLPLAERYPQLRVELVTSAQLVNVSRREADLFLSFFKPAGRSLACEPVGSIALSLYGAQAYFDRHGLPGSKEDLSRHRFVGYVDDLVQMDAVRWLDEVIAGPAYAFSSNSMLAQMSAAAAGMGLALLPRFAVSRETALRPVLAEDVVVRRPLWLSVHADLLHSSRIKAVMQYLKDLLVRDQPHLNGL